MQATVTEATCLGSLGFVATNRNNNICYFDAQGVKVCTPLATVSDSNTVSEMAATVTEADCLGFLGRRYNT